MQIIPDYELKVIKRVLMRGRQEDQSQGRSYESGNRNQKIRERAATLLALKVEEGATTRGTWPASRSRKKTQKRILFRTSRNEPSLLTPWF